MKKLIYNDISDNNLFIAYKNPFRYRSYYYDFETNLYYLNSRYYDPETGRFINADDITILNNTKDIINGLNLYAYCLNNPINTSDENGDIPKWLKWLIGGLIIVAALVVTVATGGATAGTLLASIHAFATSALIGSVTGATIGFISGGINFNNGNISWSWSGAADGFLWGSLTGAASGLAGQFVSGASKYLSKTSYILVQIFSNSTIAGNFAVAQGIATKSLSVTNVLTAFLFGGINSALGIFSSKIIKTILSATNTLLENIINKVVETFKNQSKILM